MQRQAFEALANGLAQAPSHTVADDRVADAAAHGNADASSPELIRRDVHDQQGVQPAAAREVAHTAKVGRRSQPLLAFHGRWRCARRFDSDDGQALAPTQAAPLEHRATSGGQHAFEEAVLPSARDTLRLVSTLGHSARFLESVELGAARLLYGT